MTGPNDCERNSGAESDATVDTDRDPTATAALSRAFDILRADRRRYLLYHLYDLDDAGTTYDAAVEAVIEYEAAGGDAVEVASRESVRYDLYHVQLPHLETAGLVECDHRQEYIRFRGDDVLATWVALARQFELD